MDLGGKGERHWSLPVIHEQQNTTHQLKLIMGLEGKGERHWSLPVIHVHTKHNSPAENNNGKGERH